MRLNLTENELKTARKILWLRERRARNWKTGRWICLAAAAIPLGVAIFALHTGYRVSIAQVERLQNTSWEGELTNPATIADIERLRLDISMSLATVSAPAHCYTMGFFCAVGADSSFACSIVKWRQHEEDALAAKLLRWVIDEEENPNHEVQPTGAADGPSG